MLKRLFSRRRSNRRATMSGDIPELVISVLGLSRNQGEPYERREGLGKSCLCYRFMHPDYDDYLADHPSILALHEFESSVINNSHFLYWGSTVKVYPGKGGGESRRSRAHFHLVEHTVFYQDVTSTPFGAGGGGRNDLSSFSRYIETALDRKALDNPGKLSYKSRDMICLTDEYESQRYPLGIRKMPRGFIVVVDASKKGRVFDSHLQQTEAIVRKLANSRMKFVVVATKYDRLDPGSLDKLARVLRHYGSPTLMMASANAGVNVENVFRVLAAKVLRSCNISDTVCSYEEAAKATLLERGEAFRVLHSYMQKYVKLSEEPISSVATKEGYRQCATVVGKFETDKAVAEFLLTKRNKEIESYEGVPENPELRQEFLEEFLDDREDFPLYKTFLRERVQTMCTEAAAASPDYEETSSTSEAPPPPPSSQSPPPTFPSTFSTTPSPCHQTQRQDEEEQQQQTKGINNKPHKAPEEETKEGYIIFIPKKSLTPTEQKQQEQKHQQVEVKRFAEEEREECDLPEEYDNVDIGKPPPPNSSQAHTAYGRPPSPVYTNLPPHSPVTSRVPSSSSPLTSRASMSPVAELLSPGTNRASLFSQVDLLPSQASSQLPQAPRESIQARARVLERQLSGSAANPPSSPSQGPAVVSISPSVTDPSRSPSVSPALRRRQTGPAPPVAKRNTSLRTSQTTQQPGMPSDKSTVAAGADSRAPETRGIVRKLDLIKKQINQRNEAEAAMAASATAAATAERKMSPDIPPQVPPHRKPRTPVGGQALLLLPPKAAVVSVSSEAIAPSLTEAAPPTSSSSAVVGFRSGSEGDDSPPPPPMPKHTPEMLLVGGDAGINSNAAAQQKSNAVAHAQASGSPRMQAKQMLSSSSTQQKPPRQRKSYEFWKRRGTMSTSLGEEEKPDDSSRTSLDSKPSKTSVTSSQSVTTSPQRQKPTTFLKMSVRPLPETPVQSNVSTEIEDLSPEHNYEAIPEFFGAAALPSSSLPASLLSGMLSPPQLKPGVGNTHGGALLTQQPMHTFSEHQSSSVRVRGSPTPIPYPDLNSDYENTNEYPRSLTLPRKVGPTPPPASATEKEDADYSYTYDHQMLRWLTAMPARNRPPIPSLMMSAQKSLPPRGTTTTTTSSSSMHRRGSNESTDIYVPMDSCACDDSQVNWETMGAKGMQRQLSRPRSMTDINVYMNLPLPPRFEHTSPSRQSSARVLLPPREQTPAAAAAASSTSEMNPATSKPPRVAPKPQSRLQSASGSGTGSQAPPEGTLSPVPIALPPRHIPRRDTQAQPTVSPAVPSYLQVLPN